MQRVSIIIISVCSILLLSTDLVIGQYQFTPTQIDSIIKKRWDFRSIRKNYPKSEMEIIDTIKRFCPNEVDSLAEFGTRKMKKEDYRSALSWFELVLEKEPENLQANYGIAVSKTELERFSFIERLGFWPSAEKHFKQVIKIDSTYKDVFHQYSLLQSYRGKESDAIKLIDRQLEIVESDEKFEGKRFQLYEKFLYEKSFNASKKWFESGKTARNTFYLGELYRINGKYEKADSIYEEILEENEDFPTVQVYLAQVRLYVQIGQFEKAEEKYWQAVESVSDEFEEQILFEDFVYIIKEKEYNLLKKGLPFYLLSDTYRTFWLERNPMPASLFNPRLIEHYRRLIYAEKYYRYEGLRNKAYYNELHIDLPVWYHENFKYSDIGLIYIRFGQPDENAFSARSQSMSWLYYGDSKRPRMVFHFSVPNLQVGSVEIPAPVGYWLLTPVINDPELSRDIAHWGREYHDDRRKNVQHAFQSDYHSWPEDIKNLEMFYTMSHFRKNRNEDIVQLSYAIPLSNLISKETTNKDVSLETGVVVFDNNMIEIYKKLDNYKVTDNNSKVWQNWFIDEFEFPLELSRHNIALHARVLDENKVGGYQYYYTLSDSSRSNLFCSSLKLAFHISQKGDSEIRHRDNLQIVPNPSKQFKKDEVVYAYFEIYNLTKGANDKTDYSLYFMLTQQKDRKNVFSKITGIFGGKEQYKVSIQNDYEGESEFVSDYMSFDVSKLDEGSYEIQMNIKDNVSIMEFLTLADFSLR